jgi:hypothetical protein
VLRSLFLSTFRDETTTTNINRQTPATMADSDSSLSSAPPTDDEMPVDIPDRKAATASPQKKKKKKNGTILTFFKQRSPSPPPRKRPASPPHEFVPEDNPDIAVRIGRVNRVATRRDCCLIAHYFLRKNMADIFITQFIVMFRSRFNDAFPRGSPHVGPQDIELGVAEETPSADVEGLLCALLGLVLNRKKPVE